MQFTFNKTAFAVCIGGLMVGLGLAALGLPKTGVVLAALIASVRIN